MYILVVVLPALGFFCGSIVGKFLGGIGVSIVTTLFLSLTFFISVYLCINIIETGTVFVVNLGKWIYVDTLQVDWYFYFDSLTSIMLVVITSISMLVHLYSTEYMENDPHLPRFMSYLSLFTFFMIILVTGGNFLQMFVGWEGVGLSSYLLINFWFTRIQANKSSIKAMLVNRVGDFFLLLAMFTIYFIYDTLDYRVIFSLIPLTYNLQINFLGMTIPAIDLICLFILFGAMGKSAQLGLHTWLPDAMEGPTPVSALIHAATMVTAGIFLISRCSYIFEYSPLTLNLTLVIGCITAIFGSSVALFQTDIKKIIAYSTCSQLGYMFMSCGLSGYEIALFHLYNHAFFKALLFLSAGSIVHALQDEQDIRRMAGLSFMLPFTCVMITIGSYALSAFPYTSGFYSKEAILSLSLIKETSFSIFAYAVGICGAIFTAIYSGILAFSVFSINYSRLSKTVALSAHEGSWRITFPLFFLCVMSILGGYFSKELFIGSGTTFWNTSIFIMPFNYNIPELEFTSSEYKLIPASIFLIIGLVPICFGISKKNIFSQKSAAKSLPLFLYSKWNFDQYYNFIASQTILQFSITFAYKMIDRGILEKFGPYSLTTSLGYLAEKIKYYQNGYITNYLIYVFVFLIFLVYFSICFGDLTFFFVFVIFYNFFFITK